MKSLFDQLNLRPFERRLVVGIVAVLFIALQVILVWPRFSDLTKVKSEIAKADAALETYQKKVGKLEALQKHERELKGESADLPMTEQATELQRAAERQAKRSGLVAMGYTPSNARARGDNAFFLESTLSIPFQDTGDKELLDFLVNIGGENSLIRVRDLNLRTDQNQSRLAGSLTLVATYQNSAPAKAPTTNAKKQ